MGKCSAIYYFLTAFCAIYSFHSSAITESLCTANLKSVSLATEEKALHAMKKMQERKALAQPQANEWVSELQAKQEAGDALSVMEHTSVLHAVKKELLSLEKAAPVLEKSWLDFTGKKGEAARIVNQSLPRKVLKTATYREREFHRAVFRDHQLKPLTQGQKVIKALPLVATGLAYASGVPGVEIAMGALTGYTISALAEYLTHRFYLHPNSRMARIWNRLGLIQGYHFHRDNHHSIFPAKKYNAETNEEWRGAEKKGPKGETRVLPQRDEVTAEKGLDPKDLHLNQYGMSMNWKEISKASTITISLAVPASYLLGLGWVGGAAAVAMAPLTAITTPIFHPYLHTPGEVTKEITGPVMKFFTSTPYWRFVSHTHYMHHVLPTRANFSLFLPGPDWFFGTLKKASVPDLLHMEEENFIY